MPPKIASIPAGGGAPGESSLRSLNCSTLSTSQRRPKIAMFSNPSISACVNRSTGFVLVWIFGILHLRSTIFLHNSTHLSLKTSEASNSTQLPHLVVQVGCRPWQRQVLLQPGLCLASEISRFRASHDRDLVKGYNEFMETSLHKLKNLGKKITETSLQLLNRKARFLGPAALAGLGLLVWEVSTAPWRD